jgi:hypothetical protein
VEEAARLNETNLYVRDHLAIVGSTVRTAVLGPWGEKKRPDYGRPTNSILSEIILRMINSGRFTLDLTRLMPP